MHAPNDTDSPTGRRRLRLAWWMFAALGAFYLISEHRTHLAGIVSWLPLGLLALCPLMHMFGHGSHGHATHDGNRRPTSSDHDDSRPVDLP